MSNNGAKILFISYDGMTDPLGQSQVLPYLCGLSRLGHSFTLISCEKPDAYARNEAHIRKICTEAGIDWRPLPYTKRPPVLSTMRDVQAIRQLAFRLHRKKRFDIVHCRSYISALVGLSMKRRLGLRFVFDMRGFWADERVDGGLWNLKSPIFSRVYHYFKRKEIEFLTAADYTVSLTSNARDEMAAWPALQGRDLPVQVIPCCVDLNLFDPRRLEPARMEALRSELGIAPGDFVLSYLGSLGTWYLLEEMMQFFAVLRKQLPDAKFLFISNDRHQQIMELAARLDVASGIVIRPGARAEVPYLLSLSTYSIYFIKPAFSKKASSPTKQGEIMAMGIPSICNNVGDIAHVARSYDIGHVVDAQDAAGFEAVARQLAGRPSVDAGRIKQGAREFYSLEQGVALYDQMYQQVTKSKVS